MDFLERFHVILMKKKEQHLSSQSYLPRRLVPIAWIDFHQAANLTFALGPSSLLEDPSTGCLPTGLGDDILDSTRWVGSGWHAMFSQCDTIGTRLSMGVQRSLGARPRLTTSFFD